MASSELAETVAKIMQPGFFVEYQHPGPLHEIEKLKKAQDRAMETTCAKANEIIDLVKTKPEPVDMVAKLIEPQLFAMPSEGQSPAYYGFIENTRARAREIIAVVEKELAHS